MDPEEQNSQNMFRKSMFCAIALGDLWRQLWVVIFLSSHPGASRRPRCICQICFKRNYFLLFFCICLHKDVKPDVIASAGKCPKVTKNIQKINVLNIFLETSMVPIWPGAFFTFFSLPMLGPKMASLKLSKMLKTQRFLACFCQRCTQTCEAGCDSKGRIMPKSIEKHWQYVYF